MQQLLKISLCLAVLWIFTASNSARAGGTEEDNFQAYCAECHGAGRLGSIGPALLPENLKRLRKAKAAKVIANGRPATQMPAFSEILNETEIAALVEIIYTPLSYIPQWGMDEIIPTLKIYNAVDTLPDAPVHSSDPLNLFTVVESGDHHVTILDGDTFEPIWRFKSNFALHGGAKYSPDGRYVYFGSRDGWISKYDLWSLKQVAEIRAGINTRNIAVSSDGKWVMVGNFLPHSIVILNAKVIGTGRTEKKGMVYNLDARRKVADLDLSGMPHLGSGIVFDYQGRQVMATPHLKEAAISVIDMETWETIKRIETLGPGFFARSHENTPYFWVDVFFGENKDAIHIIDKRTLEIVKTLRHEPGQTVAHVEFTRDGRYALVSIWEKDGAIIVYDANTFEELKRIPMSKPSGKYNVYNKINLSKGTSH